MGAGHTHGPAAGDRSADRRALALALALTATYTVAEVVGGLLTGSLALLADAAHMLSDNVSIALALFAVWIAAKPPTPERTFGFKRVEILAALANGITLVAVSLWIFYEAYRRFQDPPEVLGGWMLAVAVVGLFVNVGAGLVMWRSRGGSLNLEAAFRHVLADLLGSIGVIAAALVIILAGWLLADPLISVLIGLLVLASAWTILRDSSRILLEATPRGTDASEIGATLASLEGVVDVHDLHVWTITSGFPALSAHVLVRPGDDCHAIRRQLEQLVEERFGIEHTTLQVDHQEDGRLLSVGGAPEHRQHGR
ncbi:MAG: cation diffusion facilitator family transporter [Thermoleophilaceae bacterium]